MSATAWRFSASEVERAVKAVMAAGAVVSSVQIARDGQIIVRVVERATEPRKPRRGQFRARAANAKQTGDGAAS